MRSFYEDQAQLARKDVSYIPKDKTFNQKKVYSSRFHAIPLQEERPANVLELLPPGSFVNLENHPNDLPPFQVIHCKGGRCLVRQQTWGKYVHWEVEHHRLKSA